MVWWKSQRSFQTHQQRDQFSLDWDSSSLGPVGNLPDHNILYIQKKLFVRDVCSMMTLFLQVLWWIWILAAHHVWPPRLMLCHFLCSPSRSCEEISNRYHSYVKIIHIIYLLLLKQHQIQVRFPQMLKRRATVITC